MALDKTLSLSPAKRPQNADRVVVRRARLVERINEQVAAIRAIAAGETSMKPPKSTMKWWWSDGSRYYVAAYYARNPLELAKGKFSALCVDLPAAANALVAIAKAVDSGEFDEQIRIIAGEVRTKFGATKKAS